MMSVYESSLRAYGRSTYRGFSALGGILLVVTVALSYGCGFGKVNAQIVDRHQGQRVYLQSIVVDLASSRDEGGHAATVRLRSAAPLRYSQPRVSESIRSAAELRAQTTGTRPAVRFAVSGGPGTPQTAEISNISGIRTGEEFSYEDVYLWDYQQLRPFCEVELENGQSIKREGIDANFFRQHSNKCRMISPVDFALRSGSGISEEHSVTKPQISIRWEDIRRNTGSLVIEDSMLPYPGPSMHRLDQVLVNTTAELLNAEELCDPRRVEVLSLGVQSTRPDDPGDEDFFDGLGGQRVAGAVKVCSLEDPSRMATIGLPEMAVFAEGNTDFEIVVRPMVRTLLPENILNRATLVVLDREDAEVERFDVPLMGDTDFDPDNPNSVRFNVGTGKLPYEEKIYATDRDSVRYQLRLEVEHIITVKRPVYQPVDYYAQLLVTHITYCGCSKSGGSCNNGTCSCSCSSNRGYAEFEYYPDHYRVDETARQYEPTDPSSDVTYTFSQTFFFEPLLATFDKPYEELIYVEPTPRPGRSDPPDYYPEGQVIGRIGTFQSGTEIVCGPGVETVAGEPTSWTWIPPGVNSKDEEYGGCRPNFVCRLDVPPQEEIFGPGGLPTEEDYECLDYDHDSE